MLKIRLQDDLKKAVEELGYNDVDIVCNIPKNSQFGDYTTNIALQLSKQNSQNGKQNPLQTANQILEKFGQPDYIEKSEVAGGGFINFFIKSDALLQSLHRVCDYSFLVNPEVELDKEEKKKVMVEYTDPNPFKQFHIGHLFTNTVGESLARLLEATGADVKRANYFGDVGMHVAKSIYGIKQKLENDNLTLSEVGKQSLSERMKFLGQAYAFGAKAYEESDEAKEEMKKINFLIYIASQEYQKENFGIEPQINYESYLEFKKSEVDEVKKIYQKGREWSLEYFETIYVDLGTKFDFYYPESVIGEYGMKIVKEHIGDGVFQESDGAVIFPGEKYGLHNRVFINSLGLPTYEAKELGLAFKKASDFGYDQSIVITGNEINEYFKVLMMALSQINPELAKKTTHIGHGMLRMPEGKMSSRTGNVVTFEDLFLEIKSRVEKLMKNSEMSPAEKDQVVKAVSIGAMKFTILKHSPHIDFLFDLDESVSLQGDSGPYLQYTFARAKSVLRNAQYDYNLSEARISSFAYNVDLPHSEVHPQSIDQDLEEEERLLLQKIEHFPSFVEEASKELHPNLVAIFLLDFARTFNLFYQKHSIIKGEKTELRLALTCAVAVVLKQGLNLLGIEAPERM